MLAAAVLDQIRLTVARRRFAPIITGPYWHALPERPAQSPAPSPDAAAGLSHRAQQPIDGRGADVQQRAPHYRIEPQMTMALHAVDQYRQ
jgi:hypothetical protein